MALGDVNIDKLGPGGILDGAGWFLKPEIFASSRTRN